jgi:squalene-hopene/tetraprenyl-beta-curcumene cyclase
MDTLMRHMREIWIFLSIVAALLIAAPRGSMGQDVQQTGPDAAQLSQAVSRGVDFFEQAQSDDGSFSASSGTGVTAIVATALMRSGRTANDPLVARALDYLEQHVHDDGGIYQAGSRYKNYETSLAVVCFQLANRDGRYDKLLAGAEKFVKHEQWDEGEGHEISSMSYGGAGYGTHERPDLSNTSFLVDALHAVGRGKDDPALEKALVFISRCQNLESEQNTSPFAAKVNDGGFYYTAAAGGQSMAGQTPAGGLRSYGSMTYAGLKSMIYAGLERDDPRVKAACEWIRRHYTLNENPGVGAQGLYYYYHTFAKALAAVGEERIADDHGNSHDWRSELAAELISRQQPDGSWINSNPRWLEGDPNLVTGYALLALSYCRPKTNEHQPPIERVVPPRDNSHSP